MSFKEFTKKYHFSFIERIKFAKYHDTIGIGWHYMSLQNEDSWIHEFIRFREETLKGRIKQLKKAGY